MITQFLFLGELSLCVDVSTVCMTLIITLRQKEKSILFPYMMMCLQWPVCYRKWCLVGSLCTVLRCWKDQIRPVWKVYMLFGVGNDGWPTGFLWLSWLRSHAMLETIIHNTTHAGDNAGVFSRIVLIYLDSLNILCHSNFWGHKKK